MDPFTLYLGTTAGDKTGTPARLAGDWINQMNNYLFAAVKNQVKQIYVYGLPDASSLPAQSQTLEDRIAYAINQKPAFSKGVNQIFTFIVPIVSTPTEVVQVYQVWLAAPYGEVTFGQGGVQLTSGSLTRAMKSSFRNEVVALGDIGVTPIEDYINTSGPYSEKSFTATIDGDDKYYFYNGSSDVIGLGNDDDTQATDYIDLTEEDPVEPDLTNYVEFQDLDPIQYDYAHYYLTDIIANANITGDEDFVMVETPTQFYFGQKTANKYDFANCRLLMRGNPKFDFPAAPDDTHGGYRYWLLGLNDDWGFANNKIAFRAERKFIPGAGTIKAEDVSYDNSATPEVSQVDVQAAIIDVVKQTLQDSGWKNVTYGSSTEIDTALSNLRVKKIGNRIIVKGSLAVKTGADLNNVLVTFPVGYRPDIERFFCNYSGHTVGFYPVFFSVKTNGELFFLDKSEYKNVITPIDIEFTQNIN